MQNLADPPVVDANETHSFVVSRKQGKVFLTEDDGFMSVLMKVRTGPEGATKEPSAPSKQGTNIGRRPQPFDMQAMINFQVSNVHHARCLGTKKRATVGLGFKDIDELKAEQDAAGTDREGTIQKQKVNPPDGGANQPVAAPSPEAVKIKSHKPTKADVVLNPLCPHTFRNLMLLVAEDYHQVGNGYLEVVRAKGDGTITGLHHIPAADVFVYVEDSAGTFHYEIVNSESFGQRHFARWGDTASFLKRNATFAPNWFGTGGADVDAKSVSEVISFKNPSSRSRWYGFPDWLACVSSIELVNMLQQYMYDFFLNRGVPEFMLFVTGASVTPTEWAKIESSLKANIGQGNSHKTIALSLPQHDVKIQVEKLAMDSNGEGTDFAAKKDNLALDIISAHGVPPLLAGIQTPGKLGANNELPNALMSFQVLEIGPVQASFQQTLAMTLGNKEQNGGLDLTPEDFTFRSITEEIDIGTMDTVGKMRQTVPEARAQGRDLNSGTKD